MTPNDPQSNDYVFTETPGVPIKSWTRGVPVEEQAWRQMHNVASLPFIYKHVAAMPDVHWGRGATVGSVIPTSGAIVPAAVGVDIGCGMTAVQTSLDAADLPDSLARLRGAVERRVPHGRTARGGRADRGAWGSPPEPVIGAFRRDRGRGSLHAGLEKIVGKAPKLTRAAKRATSQLGTLGGLCIPLFCKLNE